MTKENGINIKLPESKIIFVDRDGKRYTNKNEYEKVMDKRQIELIKKYKL